MAGFSAAMKNAPKKLQGQNGQAAPKTLDQPKTVTQTVQGSMPSPTPQPTTTQAGAPTAPTTTGTGSGTVQPTTSGPAPMPNRPPIQLEAVPDAPTVSERLTEITGADSRLMRQARTSGFQAANRRGLLNSSMAVGAAEDAAYRTGVTVASQEAQMAADARKGALDRNANMTAKDWELREQSRAQAAQFLTNMEDMYAKQYQAIMSNDKLSKGSRTRMIESAQNLRTQQRNFVEQIYDIDIQY